MKGNAAIALYNKELKEIQSYYSKALPYMEKVRQLAPDRVKLWARLCNRFIKTSIAKRKPNRWTTCSTRPTIVDHATTRTITQGRAEEARLCFTQL